MCNKTHINNMARTYKFAKQILRSSNVKKSANADFLYVEEMLGNEPRSESEIKKRLQA